MRASASPALLAGLGLAAAFWPVLRWFAAGSMDASNDSPGLLAAATAACVIWRAPSVRVLDQPLALPIILVVLYAGMAAWGMPPAALSLLAATAIAATASAYRLGTRMDLALLALVLLSLPLAASLQFYGGYPLRIVAGDLSVAMLRMHGLGVVRESAMLVWGDTLVAIDAPCSGIKMLWAGLYLACTLAASYRLGAARTVAAGAGAFAIVIVANAVRASSLFYTETGLITMPSWAHEGIGVICFAAAAAAIFGSVRWLAGAAK